MTTKKQPNMNVGAAILFIIFSLLFFVLIFRYVTIIATGEVHGQNLSAIAQQKYEKEATIEATRGTIYDNNGEVIAEDTASFKLVAILDETLTTNPKKPRHVVDKEKTARELSKVIDLEESEIYRILSKKGAKQVEFGTEGRDISIQVKTEIENLKLPGITFLRGSKRFYPNGIFSSHLVGYVDVEEETNKTVGELGIEMLMNKELTGSNGKLNYPGDFWGYILPGSEEKVTAAKDGYDIYLTLDKKIQTLLEDALNKVDEEYKPAKMVAVVADPKTGKILAMGQRPTFHPTTREGISDTWHNEVIENSFEPGSTMKIFTLAAAIQEGVFNPNEGYQSGSYKPTENSQTIHDHNRSGWGTISYLEGLQRSSNVAFAKLVKEKIGYDTFREYLTKFGFDQPTGIDLPNEASGKIVYQYPIDKITTGYGQGSAITPIQQIQAATAIANGGKMVRPHVIDKIVDPTSGKTVKQTETEVVGTPISEETADQVLQYLETVVSSPKGTGYNRYNIEGYQVAGKTGTASMTQNGRYLDGKNDYVFSFLGMAPAEDPRLVIYVAVQQPKVEHYSEGSIPVSMIFNSVMKNSLKYLNIEPAEQKEVEPITISDFLGKNIGETEEQIASFGAHTVVIGNGTNVIAQSPKAGEKVLVGEKVFLVTDGDLTMPDVTGFSLRDVVKIASLANLELSTTGSGYVTKQNISVGNVINSGDPLVVHLKAPTEEETNAGNEVSEEDGSELEQIEDEPEEQSEELVQEET
jgi:penicillin-binding protein 2B